MIAFLRQGGLRKLAGDRRGNVLTLTAFALPVLLGGAGLAVDTAQWYLWKRELQLAADAGALSGAFALSQGKDYAARARGDATGNINVADLTGAPQVSLGNWGTRTNNAVTVTLSARHQLAFSSLFLPEPPTVTATATAAYTSDGEHCMISLDPSSPDAVKIGGNALLRLGCGIASNSRDPSAIRIFGSAQVDADPLSAVGGIIADDLHLIGNTTKRPYSAPQADPLGALTTPVDGPARTYDKNTAQLLPGTYSSLELKANHTMAPGVYTISGGTLSVNGNNSLSGDGVVIVLKNGAKIDINGGSTIDLRAPDAVQAASLGVPSMEGVLIYEDKATSTGGTSKINGNATLHLSGAVYLPKQTVQLQGNASPSTQCLLLVSLKIDVSGNPIIPQSCPAGTNTQFDFGARVVRLVQ